MGITNLGAVGISAGGVYNSETVYKKYKVVSANGGSYMYINPTPAAGVPLTDTSHWQQIASIGGQDLVDAAVAARDDAAAYAAQLAAGTASPAGTYADLAALIAADPDHSKIYITLDDGNWCYHNGSAWVAGGVYQAASVAVDIAAINYRLDKNITKNGYRAANGKPWRKYSLPESFNSALFPINIYTDGINYIHDFNIVNHKNTGGTTYYVSATANETQYPTDENHPTTLQHQLSRNDIPTLDGDTIILLDGVYRDIANMVNYKFEKNINLIAKNPGKVVFANIGLPLSYTSDGGGVYHTTRSNVVKVVQLLDSSAFQTTPLKKVDSPEACIEEGTWHLTAGSVLYVHLLHNAVPSFSTLFVLLNYNKPALTVQGAGRDVNLYIDGINFLGGTPATITFEGTSGYVANLFAKDCKFLYAYDTTLAQDAVSIRGGNAYMVGCEGAFSSKDGFNYRAYNGYAPSFIEINCVGANNGIDGVAESAGSPFQNGSTAHDGAKGIRIGGIYCRNYGANIGDVHVGTETINIGCVGFDSAYKGVLDAARTDFAAQQAGAKMHLIGCRAFGTINSIYCAADAEMIIDSCDFEGNLVIDGTITETQ